MESSMRQGMTRNDTNERRLDIQGTGKLGVLSSCYLAWNSDLREWQFCGHMSTEAFHSMYPGVIGESSCHQLNIQVLTFRSREEVMNVEPHVRKM